MEIDDGDFVPCRRVIVPSELVEAIIEAAMDAMDEWHEKTQFPAESLTCAAAMRIAEQTISEMLLGAMEGETIQ